MKATTREDLNLKEDETMCEKCVHENICRREQCGEPFCVIRSCFDFEEKRPHGEWENERFSENHTLYFGKCSQCGKTGVTGNFCMRCGADMREEGEAE